MSCVFIQMYSKSSSYHVENVSVRRMPRLEDPSIVCHPSLKCIPPGCVWWTILVFLKLRFVFVSHWYIDVWNWCIASNRIVSYLFLGIVAVVKRFQVLTSKFTFNSNILKAMHFVLEILYNCTVCVFNIYPFNHNHILNSACKSC